MIRKVISGIMLTLLLTSGTLTFNIRPAMAIGTIYIRADGSVDPPTAPIQREGDAYTLTSNITCDFDGIVIERDNMTLDGAGYTLQGAPPVWSYKKGLVLIGRSNITINGMWIRGFLCGVWLNGSSYNIFSGNNLTDNAHAIDGGESIRLYSSSHNIISGNNILGPARGITVQFSSSNVISGNTIPGGRKWAAIYIAGPSNNNTVSENNVPNSSLDLHTSNSIVYRNRISRGVLDASGVGVYGDNNTVCSNEITDSFIGMEIGGYNNTVYENMVARSYYGIKLSGSNNKFYHNNLVDESEVILRVSGANLWDDGYPSGGNYWSDYSTKYPSAQELDDSGIWDTPYVINDINQDNNPLMEPWIPNVTASLDIDPGALNLRNEGKWITAYAQFPEGYDPADINASTILLNGTIAPVLDHKYGFIKNPLVDYNGDGILEYMLKFDGTAVQGLIYNQGFRNCEVALTVTGKLFDDTAFEGTYTVKVVADTPSKR